MWFRWMGTTAIYWALGGYAVWTTLISIALHGREKKLRKELGL
jgi:protein-S-isoprenylcysteine O-methyltransferase Ste14